MLVLIIAVAALLGFLAVVALLAMAHYAEGKTASGVRSSPPEPIFAGLTYDQAFEENCGLIWQTQIPVLLWIRSAGPGGVPVQSLRPWFSHAARRYPSLFEGHSFEEWLEFLHRSRVAYQEDGYVVLSSLGYDLLEHCRMAG